MNLASCHEVLTKTSRQDHHGERPGYLGSKKEKCQIYTSQKDKNKFLFMFQQVTRKRQQNRLDLSLQEYLELLSINWAEQFAEPQNSRTPSNHHHLQAGHQAQHGGVRLYGLKFGRNGTRTGGRTTNGQNNGEVRQHRTRALVAAGHTMRRQEGQRCRNQHVNSDRMSCLVPIFPTEVVESCSFALSLSTTERCRHTYLYARRHTFFSCTHHSAQFTHRSALFQGCHIGIGSRYKGSVSRISQKHCHLFVMSLLGVPSVRFPLFASSPTCSLSRPSASSTSLERTTLNPCPSAHWSGMSGCLVNPTPNTGSGCHPTFQRQKGC